MVKEDQKIEKVLDSIVDDVVVNISKPNLDSLKDTLTAFHVPSYRYSILHDKDDTLCLTCSNGKWLTYASERGSKSGIKSFAGVDEACFDLMRSMVLTDEDYAKMKATYLKFLDKKVEESGQQSLHSIIRDGFKKMLSTVASL